MKELENSNSARRNGNTVVFEPMDLTMKTGRKISLVIAGSFFFGGGGVGLNVGSGTLGGIV